MLALNWTDTLNVDLWNVWTKIFLAAIAYMATGNLIVAYVVAAVFVVAELKLGDLFAKDVQDSTGIPDVTCTHSGLANILPVMPIAMLVDRLPFLKGKTFDVATIQSKIGFLGDPATIGILMGLIIGVVAGEDVPGCLSLAIAVAAYVVVLPRIAQLFSEALMPIFQRRDHLHEGPLPWPQVLHRSGLAHPHGQPRRRHRRRPAHPRDDPARDHPAGQQDPALRRRREPLRLHHRRRRPLPRRHREDVPHGHPHHHRRPVLLHHDRPAVHRARRQRGLRVPRRLGRDHLLQGRPVHLGRRHGRPAELGHRRAAHHPLWRRLLDRSTSSTTSPPSRRRPRRPKAPASSHHSRPGGSGGPDADFGRSRRQAHEKPVP